MSKEMIQLLTSSHAGLSQCAGYFFENGGGKFIRPTMVVLCSKAVSGGESPLLPTQRRLAEITEMIHTASLFHDDVLDSSPTRRSLPSVNSLYGNKLAILAGDFLLAKASVSLSRLRNLEVVELMSTVIEHLVQGEVMQLNNDVYVNKGVDEVMEYYLRKNFYKTASLMANSCMSSSILSNSEPELIEATYLYGKHLGTAFQLIDDVLDYEGEEGKMGKPRYADLRGGVVTGPLVWAGEEFEEVREMVGRGLRGEGDLEKAIEIVHNSSGLPRTLQLAKKHAELAVQALEPLQDSVYKEAMGNLAVRVIERDS
ncbi:hypothetical protein TrVE_jg11864 [Triparma verrucosa]|uniref:Uncharacterized protein n=2 Tax=Triparma TaxID=722752 RepID=A0A9W7DXM3_9STRA|nr:hypothetical protein TrST_g5894 [Triparma strigata]GMI03503.1 hypothetical protein TrVE_jg11864 [Triparma verrucosa]